MNINKDNELSDKNISSNDWEIECDSASLVMAKNTELVLFENTQNSDKTTTLIASFVASCNQRGEKPLDQWLHDEFRKYPEIWENEEEIRNTTRDVIESTVAFNVSRHSLQRHQEQGRSRASWLANEIEKNAAVSGSVDVGRYATDIDSALADATANARKIVSTLGGEINGNYNLDGFIAEQHHVDTFNIDATVKGSPYRARMVNSHDLNSVDIEIVDVNGNVVGQYQSKYGSDAKSTHSQFERGDYSGQQRLVPEGQGNDVPNSTEVIEADGVSSTPLSKEKAKALQKQAQAERETYQYEWKDTNRIDIAKKIGKQALFGACIAVGMQGVRILARRAWNRLNGRQNPSVNDDLKEFFSSSLRSTTETAAQIAVSGAVVVAVKNGYLGALLRNTPAGLITNIACVGLQNAKVLYKLGKGELTQSEALDEIGSTTVTASMAILGATKSAMIGVTMGTVFGPIGMAAGGFIGGVAGGIAGSKVGEIIYDAGKVVAKKAIEVVSSVVESTGQAIKSIGRGISNFASSLFSLW
ncbi:hypothetical protein [Providencia sp. Marseille-Q8014]